MIEKVKDQDKKVWYGEVLIIKDRKRLCGYAKADNKADAKKKLRESVIKEFGNKKFKYLQLWELPEEMEIEVK